jgi:hypothetical protein
MLDQYGTLGGLPFMPEMISSLYRRQDKELIVRFGLKRLSRRN